MRRLPLGLLTAFLLCTGCSFSGADPDVATGPGGSGVETEARGTLWYDNDSTAKFVSAYLVPIDHEPTTEPIDSDSTIDSALTDAQGGFSLKAKTSHAQWYFVYALDDNSRGVRSEPFLGGDVNDLGKLTMQTTGSITGVVKLIGGGDVTAVSVFAYGLNIQTYPRTSTGVFVFEGLPAGYYDLRFVSPLDAYGPGDKEGVQVLPGVVTNIDTVELPFHGLLAPQNVRVSLDTATQFVTVAWSPVESGNILGYNVYRTMPGYNPGDPITSKYVAPSESTYVDTTPIPGVLYEYRVSSVDSVGQYESNWIDTYTDTVTTTGIATLSDTFSLQSLRELVALAVLPDGGFVVGENGFYPGIRVYDSSGVEQGRWFPGEILPIGEMYVKSDTAGNLFVINMADEKYCGVFKCDANGKVLSNWVVESGKYYGHITGLATAGHRVYVSTEPGTILARDIADLSTTSETAFEKPQGLPLQINTTKRLWYNPLNGALYMQRGKDVFALDPSAQTTGSTAIVTTHWAAHESGEMAVRGDGAVCVAGDESQTVYVYSPVGALLARVGTDGAFSKITSLAFSRDGALWVLGLNSTTSLWQIRTYTFEIQVQ